MRPDRDSARPRVSLAYLSERAFGRGPRKIPFGTEGPVLSGLNTVMPPRDATNAYLHRLGREMDISFDVDLGELISGHHVMVRGLELGATISVPRWMAEAEDRQSEMPINRPPQPGITVTRRTLTPEDLEVVGTRKLEPDLHYEFVPGIERAEEEAKGHFFWYWTL